ncbi:ATP-binding protein [Bifidobacterium callimiconis]|uniref:Histidine kinase n=1 Tax=Bifidobacterium callimiconis TaxID=2306973 RepID=A0A430FE58_9BIFI|nr:ATP-binding protein [Bifidobacterium callimiconis]RSX51107.1 histidine kinase [Bifidobacterium callimiconis]
MMIVLQAPPIVTRRTIAGTTAGGTTPNAIPDATGIGTATTTPATSAAPLRPLAPAHTPLLRPDRKHGGLLCGACSGLAAHLGLPTPLVRAFMVLAAPLFGFGLVLYVFLWAFVPKGDPRAVERERTDVVSMPLAKGNTDVMRSAAVRTTGMPYTNAAAPGATTGSAYGFSPASGRSLADLLHDASAISVIVAAYTVIVPLTMLLGSLFHELSPAITLFFAATGVLADWVLRRYPRTSGRISLTVGLSFLTLALFAFSTYIGYERTANRSLRVIVCVLMLAGAAALMIGPRVTAMTRRLADEQAAKEREEERADMAAHLHDGVLQTLSLIQVNADDPTIVRQLAHAQERELRSWLYQRRGTESQSFVTGLREAAAEAEARVGEPIDVVTVGDVRPDGSLTALLEATREALTNAAKHGRPPISVYCEVVDDGVDVYVKDHGTGFDPHAIPEGRLGVRESIMGRVLRRGGQVEIESSAELGTEVHMHMPITPAAPTAPTVG